MEKVNSQKTLSRHKRITKLGFIGYLRHHAFALGQGLKNMVATPFASLLTLAVIAFAIALPLLLWGVLANIQSLARSWESTQVSVFLKKETTYDDTQRLLKQLQQHPLLARVEYIPAAQGIKDFERQTGLSNVLSALQTNPLPDVMTLYPVATLQTPQEVAALITEVKAYPSVESVHLDMAWVQRLHTFSLIGQRLVYGLALLLGIGVLLIIINAIRSTSQTTLDKIQVIKLIGGSNRFIRRPFLYMGLLYSVVACGLAIAVVNYCLLWLNEPIQQIAQLYQVAVVVQGLPQNIVSSVLLISAALGYLGAWLSLAGQLRKAEHY